jgi:hypothetical protein
MSNGLHITRISSIGIWLQAYDNKYFMSYGEYPFFKNRPLNALLNVREKTPGRFYWPDLNAYVTVESLRPPLKASGESFSSTLNHHLFLHP